MLLLHVETKNQVFSNDAGAHADADAGVHADVHAGDDGVDDCGHYGVNQELVFHLNASTFHDTTYQYEDVYYGVGHGHGHGHDEDAENENAANWNLDGMMYVHVLAEVLNLNQRK